MSGVIRSNRTTLNTMIYGILSVRKQAFVTSVVSMVSSLLMSEEKKSLSVYLSALSVFSQVMEVIQDELDLEARVCTYIITVVKCHILLDIYLVFTLLSLLFDISINR